MEFLQLSSGKMLNLNSVSLISIQYNSVVYELNNGSDKIYEEFETVEEANERYEEISDLILG